MRNKRMYHHRLPASVWVYEPKGPTLRTDEVRRTPNPARRALAIAVVSASWLSVQTGCTHTTLVQPGLESTALVSAQVAVADREINVQTLSGDVLRVARVTLTPDSLSGVLRSKEARFDAPLVTIDRLSFKSRWTGIRDWVALGAIGGVIGVPVLLCSEECSAWAVALAPVGALVGAMYGVAIGSIWGSTIEFRFIPGEVQGHNPYGSRDGR